MGLRDHGAASTGLKLHITVAAPPICESTFVALGLGAENALWIIGAHQEGMELSCDIGCIGPSGSVAS